MSRLALETIRIYPSGSVRLPHSWDYPRVVIRWEGKSRLFFRAACNGELSYSTYRPSHARSSTISLRRVFRIMGVESSKICGEYRAQAVDGWYVIQLKEE
jgi:hypothetical protein